MRHLSEGSTPRTTTSRNTPTQIPSHHDPALPQSQNTPQKPRKSVNKQKSNAQKRFWIENLLARETTIFAEKIQVLIFYLKFIKPNPNGKKSLPRVQTFEFSRQICQNLKLKSFGLSPLPMQNPYSKTLPETEPLPANRPSKPLRHTSGPKERQTMTRQYLHKVL